jgi:predicted metal-dependent enzyme (double-stranded beta helix superfamily)
MTLTRIDHLALAQSYARNPGDWRVAPQYDAHDRWYECLSDDSDAQVWLLTWLPGQGTDLHDHGGSAGAFVVVSGLLTEQTVVTSPRGPIVADASLTAGRGRRFGAHHIHRIVNTGTQPAISVHVYGPRLETMTRYAVEGRRLRVAKIERAGSSW